MGSWLSRSKLDWLTVGRSEVEKPTEFRNSESSSESDSSPQSSSADGEFVKGERLDSAIPGFGCFFRVNIV